MIRTGIGCLFLLATTLVHARQAAAPAEVEVAIAGYEGFELAGTLSLPARVPAGGAPGVLLLAGSGPTDRDGNQPSVRTDLLKTMARRLADEGFAVLRFDKRATARLTGRWPADPAAQQAFYTWEAFTGDARAALDFLRGRPEVDRARIAVCGHSEGGMVALQLAGDLAAAGSPPAALVLAGTPAKRMDELLRIQLVRSLHLDKSDEATRKRYLDAIDGAIRSVLETGTAPADLPYELSLLFQPHAARLLRSYFTIDLASLARSYPGPVLVLHGAMDSQVPAEEHTTAMLAALASRPGGVQERVVVPGASHNFKPAASVADFGFAGDVVPQALDALAGFLSRVLAKPAT